MDARENELNIDPGDINNDDDNENEMIEDDDSLNNNNNNVEDDVLDGGVASDSADHVHASECPLVSLTDCLRD